MSEIEKLYENAGCKKVFDCSECYKPCDNDICNFDSESKFASFTAEKQLELICFIVKSKERISFTNKPHILTRDAIANGLAFVINTLWQSLSDSEKAEIKRILE